MTSFVQKQNKCNIYIIEMIHEAKVKFHAFDMFNFYRKQDANNIKIDEQNQMLVMVDRHYINFLVDQENPLCKIKNTIIDFITNKQSQQKQICICYLPPAKKSQKVNHIRLATIKSSKTAIQKIKQTIDKNRKYKSCLSFIPSRVKHISILSGQSPTQKFRGFINLAGVMFLILNLRNILENFLRYGIQFGSTPTAFVPISFIIAMFMYLIFPIISFSIEKLKFKNIFAVGLAKMFFYCNFISILGFNVLYCLIYKPSPVLGLLHTSFGMVLLLKLISFYQVNQQLYALAKKLQQKPKTKSQRQIQEDLFVHYQVSQQNLKEIQQHKGKPDGLINLKKLFYFIAVPTLCYQLSYPQTTSIRIAWLIKRIVQLLIMASLQGILMIQYIQPELNEQLKAVHSDNTTWYQLFNQHLRIAVPNTILWIIGFYSFFHLWLNIIGQLTYFGDRNFYRDWWNCRSIEEYWKTWNLPVHFWFIRHVYNPLIQAGTSKVLANIVVFFISAIAHQYVVSVPLGFVSYWAFLAMMMQAPAILVQKKTDKILRIQNSELSNASFWVFFCIIGQPLVVFIYYSMYIDYMNNQSSPKIKGFIPLQLPLQL